MEPILSVRELSFSYGPTQALNNVSFDIETGDYVGLAGPNGAGKTTLTELILGLLKKQQGTIMLFGQDSGGFSEWSRVGFVPQRAAVLNPLFPATVREVVGLGLLSQKRFPKKIAAADKRKIEQALSVMDIADLRDKIAGELSGGQQQRVFLARAMVSDPEFLILDEPGTALDPQSSENFFELVKKLNQEKGITVVMITHDLGQIGKYAGKLLYLDKKVVFYGGFKNFCESEKMTHYFGPFSQHLICHQHETR